MLNQRESDIAHVEAKLEIQQLLTEWAKDYLGNRHGDQTGSGIGEAEGSEGNPAEGAGERSNIEGQTGPQEQGPAY